MIKRKTYVLVDPNDYSVRYVGSTSKNISARFWHHMYDGNKFPETEKNKWIASLVENGQRPECIVVSEFDVERSVIIELRQSGADLFNKVLPRDYRHVEHCAAMAGDASLKRYSTQALLEEIKDRGYNVGEVLPLDMTEWRSVLDAGILRLQGVKK